MAMLQVERLGGLAGFGGAGGHVRSMGQLDMETLSAEEQRVVEGLFQSKGMAQASEICDGFCYRISLISARRTETIQAMEVAVPIFLARCVKDEIV